MLLRQQFESAGLVDDLLFQEPIDGADAEILAVERSVLGAATKEVHFDLPCL